ncbi:Succinate semialdehyde dehydrogenase [Penicillium subrubescens]|uniref:Succinate semialdehyde dehydrogenase n=1 Tax=Penicillium subrubescens TaxID=1316194 RepID=UPI002544FD39|nr:Succinate semialdehyde dehydrogenase [Penicillium subrubescens]KAJ5875600.1 Succinate semialdehyde dehydrogenase [Penicillium subrubescens]
MYKNLGLNWASTLLAFVSLVLSLVPTLMFVWGKEFSKHFVEETKIFQVGDGQNAASTHGPLTNGVVKTQEHISDAVSKNASVPLGDNPLPSFGKNFHELTILGNVDGLMKIAYEETFGPVAALAKFSTEDEVARRANSCEVGLASYLMTSDQDSAATFSGVKHSGMGRKGSKYGIDDYVNIKMIVTGDINTVYTSNL